MLANYHTHTWRCGHAAGSEIKYVENAVAGGLRVLGFSDHATYWDSDSGPRVHTLRMAPEELPDYAETVRALAERYRGRIGLRLGVEAEYYPHFFPALLRRLRDHGVEYMILGQHFLGDERDEPYCGRATEDAQILERYVAQSIEGLQTGLYSYFAHPDLVRFVGDAELYARQMRRLCEAAKAAEVPLEINLLGLREGRNYPDERFWAIAGAVGNAVVLGCDAHRPQDVCDRVGEETALGFVRKYGLRLLDAVPLRPI